LWADLRQSTGMGRVDIAHWLGMSDGLFIFLVTLVAAIAFVVVTKIQAAVNKKYSKDFLEELGVDELKNFEK